MARKLTSKEIDNILDFFVPQKDIPEETANAIVKQNKNRLRKQLVNQKIYPCLIPELKKQIIESYKESIIQAGESVGILCAQSIGERQTQMSVAYDEKIVLVDNGDADIGEYLDKDSIIHTTIGEYIDDELENGDLINLGNGSVEKMMNKKIKILTVNQKEKLEWQNITSISRHPPNGGMVKVITKTGRSAVTTLSHSHLCRKNDRIEPILASELKIGDSIPIVKKISKGVNVPIPRYIEKIIYETFDDAYADTNECLRIHPELDKHIVEICKTEAHPFHNMNYLDLREFIEECENNKEFDNYTELNELKQAYNADIVWDPIVSIEEVTYMYPFVYDFSVVGNETFALQSGIIVHNTLNTFHKAGQSEKTVVAGVPRFQELLNATKEPKMVSCKIFFKEGNDTIQQLRETINHSIVELTFAKISKSMEVCINKQPEEWYEVFKILYDDEFTKYTDCISIKINMDILYEYKLTLQEIAETMTQEYDDLFCVFSPPNIGQFDIFVDTSQIILPEKRIVFIDQDNKNTIYLEECVQPTIEKMIISGIQGISHIYYTQENDEWIVETDGSNYTNILAHSKVDMTRTTSNNVWDIYEVLGIEAAREFLIEEYMSIMEGINKCHAQLLVERMTYSGTISSISRYTMRREESGPMGKASFEETMDNFLKAAAQGDIEPTNGVSASIICGKRAPIGTGIMNLKIDLDNLPVN